MNSPPESRVMVKSGAALPVANMSPHPRCVSIPPTQDDRRPPSRQSGVRLQSSESGADTIRPVWAAISTSGISVRGQLPAERRVIQGSLNAAYEAVVRLAVRGSAGQTCQCAVGTERGSTRFGAQVPDLPGCVAGVETEAEVLMVIREAIEHYNAGSWLPGTPYWTPSGPIAQSKERRARIGEVVGLDSIRPTSLYLRPGDLHSCAAEYKTVSKIKT